jgi:hypothetical protein
MLIELKTLFNLAILLSSCTCNKICCRLKLQQQKESTETGTNVQQDRIYVSVAYFFFIESLKKTVSTDEITGDRCGGHCPKRINMGQKWY